MYLHLGPQGPGPQLRHEFTVGNLLCNTDLSGASDAVTVSDFVKTK